MKRGAALVLVLGRDAPRSRAARALLWLDRALGAARDAIGRRLRNWARRAG